MIVVSHRGPYAFIRDEVGGFTARRGAGGLASALAPLLGGRADATWIAAAMSDDDLAAVATGAASAVAGTDLRLLALDAEAHRLHYDVASNGVLWFLHHDLFGLGDDPSFDDSLHRALDAYRDVNDCFAEAVCDTARAGDAVLVHDYQLALVPALVRRRRPDLRVQHFTHTPFCGPDAIRVLPDAFASDLLGSLASGPAGFHTTRWAGTFRSSVAAALGDGPARQAGAFVAPLGPDAGALRAEAATSAVAEELRALDDLVGDRKVVVRADRIEPSKNVVRGFAAFDRMLEREPSSRGGVVFVAMLYPSRQTLPLYREHTHHVRAMAERVNERWARADWTPVVLDERDHFARTLAGYQRADVVFVNSVKDGLNLVAKEAPLVNLRDAVLCLSREAGAHAELRDACVTLHPFDVEQQAAALGAALAFPAGERAPRAALLRRLAAEVTPQSWLDRLLANV